MGKMLDFVVDLVQERVGEGGSRSFSRVPEHDSYLLTDFLVIVLIDVLIGLMMLFRCAV